MPGILSSFLKQFLYEGKILEHAPESSNGILGERGDDKAFLSFCNKDLISRADLKFSAQFFRYNYPAFL